MKKSMYYFLFLITVTFTILAGCSEEGNASRSDSGTESGSDNGDGKPKVAVVLKGSDQEYFKLAEQGAKQAFEDFDVNGTYMAATTQTDTTQIINILEDQLIEKPDALVVMPSTEEQIPVLQRYNDDGIPVLLIDTNLEWDGKDTYIGTDNYTAGQTAAEHLASLLSEGDQIAILEGVTGAKVNEDRVQGVKDKLEELGIEIVASQSADFDRVKAVTVMENILTANPDIDGVFTANDAMGMGALEAVQGKGLDLPVVGIDGTTDALESISNGGMAGTVSQDPFNMAYLGVENALKVLDGEKIDELINSGSKVITQDNAAEELNRVNELLGK
ncbi:sugar ABC transporter substrate-binding protein [Oceanobacillus sp. Castelsardo]|uniref:sugar ABC transporter substrate-binding protein n=1 Tax=Oceanobacillus sp. Castelsardo TaxID=1851204 RepID=UPI00083842C9|nr:sugar ABC transporter substrate-binding protein [Oceanobacillus sp. Castelsardo]